MATIVMDNSFCTLVDFPSNAMDNIKRVLTYRDESIAKDKMRIFMQMRIAQSRRNLRYYHALKKQLDTLGPDVVCLLRDNQFPSGLINSVLSVLKPGSYSLKDKRKRPEEYLTLRWENRPFPLRPYQEEMVDIATRNERGVFEACVASGKTRVMTEIIKNNGVNTLVIVPSLALLEQTYRTFLIAFGAKNVQIVKSATLKGKASLKPIRIVNVQTLASLQKKQNLQRLIEDVDMVLVDEVHHAGAATYVNLLKDLNHIYYRYGFSGTFLRNDNRTMEMHGFLSNVLYEYPPSRGVKEKYITPADYSVMKIPGFAHGDYKKEYDRNYCSNKAFLSAIGRVVDKIPSNEQILILVERKEKTGAQVEWFLKECGFKVTYISGDNKKEDIANAIEAFNEKKIRILIGTSVIGEGVDVHSTKHLIIGTGGKSEIRFVQAVGRCVRLHEGKQKSHVYDFDFAGTRYLQKHLRERIKIFQENFAGEIKYI